MQIIMRKFVELQSLHFRYIARAGGLHQLSAKPGTPAQGDPKYINKYTDRGQAVY
jgi:hypothetical protein